MWFLRWFGNDTANSEIIDIELLASPESAQARDVIRRHRAETLYVDVDDPAILRDIDTRLEYNDLLVETPG